jgi:hypothetical protein
VVAVALGAGCGRSAELNDEMRDRDAYVRRLAEGEGLLAAWSLMSRSTIVFDDGFAPIEMIDPEATSTAWNRTPSATSSGLAQPIRWMGPRAHLRVRSDRGATMQLELRGRVDVTQLYTHPLVAASFEGDEFSSAIPDDDGYFTISAELPANRLADWADIYVSVSSVHEPWRDLTTLKVIRLEHASWEPVPAGAAGR